MGLFYEVRKRNEKKKHKKEEFRNVGSKQNNRFGIN